VNGESGYESRADGEEDHGDKHDGDIVAYGTNKYSSEYRSENGGNQEGKQLDSGLCGRGSFDGLEVDGKVVYDGKESCTKEECKRHCENHITIAEETRWKCALLSQSDLGIAKQD